MITQKSTLSTPFILIHCIMSRIGLTAAMTVVEAKTV
jgi:hypothetical protein